MLEKPFFFPWKERRLFGVLHSPERKDVSLGFVFCHPFAEEKLWTHRVFVSFARELARRGIAVLRFDFMGHGDSDGHFGESTVDTRLDNIHTAVEYLKTEVPAVNRIGFLGLRFGATLAALAAERRVDVTHLLLWEPIVDGGRYMQEMLRGNLTAQLANFGKVSETREQLVEKMKAGQPVNVDGYEITHALFDQISAIKLLEHEKRFPGACEIVQIGKEGQPPRPELQRLKDSYKNARLQAAVEEPFWREIKRYYGRAENLFAATLASGFAG